MQNCILKVSHPTLYRRYKDRLVYRGHSEKRHQAP